MADFRLERNLLFGLLAVRNTFVTAEALKGAIDLLAADRAESLDQVLLQLKLISEDDHALLRALMHRHLQRYQDDPEAGLSALNQVAPNSVLIREFAPLFQPGRTGLTGIFQDPELTQDNHNDNDSTKENPNPRETLYASDQRAPQNPNDPDDTPSLTDSGSPPRRERGSGNASDRRTPGSSTESDSGSELGAGGGLHARSGAQLRYRILHGHAKGGLGQVFVALDKELNREVALKEIQPQFVQQDGSHSRFLLEARVTGTLEHPGIVPVYGLGHYADGRPYYAMRFIKGESLKDAIEVYHRRKGQWQGGREQLIAFRQLLVRFVDVCNTIAFAHSRGVLHRDIKPSNIMLGKYGETLVVDWGLAKLLDRPRGKLSVVVRERAVAEQIPHKVNDTRTGSVIGTPQYMSPEQANPLADRAGPESDVYSLGVTLYCILVGQPPFAAANQSMSDLLADVREGRFPPPRARDRKIDPELESICLRAMAKNPRDRYKTADDLAADVECWLICQPVTAHEEPWHKRIGTWFRRRRRWTRKK